MNLTDVMDQLATRLDTISGLRCYAFPADSVTPPAAVVGYPDTYTYDETYGRGMDRMSLPVFVLVARTPDRQARKSIGAYVDGSGTSSVKAVLESGTYTAFSTLRVESVEITQFNLNGTDFICGEFTLDIAGTGA